MDKESCGSVRNPKGTNSVDAMKSCSNLLTTYGGHALASGFRVKNENLDKYVYLNKSYKMICEYNQKHYKEYFNKKYNDDGTCNDLVKIYEEVWNSLINK